ncbi:MAG: nuclear transport factor 2 family protein [Bacteroidetes bacterium]|nr:nuclear transport factor 2 family protein [Bacteroidota bacterium]
MRAIFLALALLIFAPVAVAQPTNATQDPVAAVRAVVMELFDAMRAGDSTRVRDVFHEDARLHSSFSHEGVPMIGGGDSADGFVTVVGTPHDEVWDERVGEIHVRVDEGLATAWMDYRFFLGEAFSHCGVNAIQLVLTEDGWKMLNVVDTRRSGCE